MAEIDRVGLPESYEKHSDKDKSHNCNPHSSVLPQSLPIFCHIPGSLEFEVFSLGTEITMWREEKSELRKVVRHAHYETAMRR